ncbi:MAG: AAA family ATPase [Tissierellia bacterium]|nr:AAA family ATPase [Tissierellia bacterium]
MEYKILMDFLEKHGVKPELLKGVEDFRKEHGVEEKYQVRIPNPRYKYYGREIWNKVITGVLEGQHLLLSGPKATGKNVLCENLALLFGRPQWNVSLNVTTDSAGLIGADTFAGGEVRLRPGPIYLAAEKGGFAILDEINMAKNEALSVIHSALDYRRILDVPGYHLLPLHEATRFIGTMNYGYIGTRELNEALVSRFLVIDMPTISPEDFKEILEEETTLKDEYIKLFVRLFLDLQEKSLHSEISSKPIDLRGLMAAIQLMKRGLSIGQSLDMGMVDKSFDSYEKEIVRDIIDTLIPKDLDAKELFK